jgi:hypothetical protein
MEEAESAQRREIENNPRNAVTGFQLTIKQWKFMAAQAFRRQR